MSEQSNSSVQRFLRSELSFYGTIVVAVFTVATMYFGLTNRMDLLNQKFEYFSGNYSDLSTRYAALELRLTASEKEIALLQAKSNNP